MRILQLLSQVQPTGAEAYALTLADWLKDQGHEVFLASDCLHAKTSHPYIPLAVHDRRWWVRIRSTFFLRRFLKENRIQVIHCHSRAAARLAFWARWGQKVAVVSTIHGRQPVSLSKKLLDIYGEKCISICENLSTQLCALLGMNPRKIRLLRNPLAIEELPFIEDVSREPKIAWIGRLTGPKGDRARDFITQTAPVLLAEFPALQIEMIGGEPALLGEKTLQVLRQLQERYQNRLQVRSHLANLHRELGRFQLIVGAGRVALGALLSGVPTYALGEYSAEGLINRARLPQAMASNMGDIGGDGKATTPVDSAGVTAEIVSFLKNPSSLSREERRDVRETLIRHYGRDGVCRKIFNVYKSAYFLKNHPRSIPVLMYHKVPDQALSSRHRIFVTKTDFEAHLKFFRRQGFTTLTFRDLEEFRSGQREFSQFPQKPLVLTFDDGYLDNLTNAAPLLKKYQMKAVIYLLADHGILENSWDADGAEPLQALMTLEQKKRLSDFDFEIGSHGLSHRNFQLLNAEQMQGELVESKQSLEKDFGRVLSFAYPYGCASEAALELAEEAGYEFAVKTDSGGLVPEENPFGIFRINIFPEDGPAQLRKKTAPWYRYYFYLKRGR